MQSGTHLPGRCKIDDLHGTLDFLRLSSQFNFCGIICVARRPGLLGSPNYLRKFFHGVSIGLGLEKLAYLKKILKK